MTEHLNEVLLPKCKVLIHDDDMYRRTRQICSCSCQVSLAHSVTQPSLLRGKPHKVLHIKFNTTLRLPCLLDGGKTLWFSLMTR